MNSVLFHLALAVCHLAFVALVRRSPSRAWEHGIAWALACAAIAVLGSRFVYPDVGGIFEAMRLLAWLAFVHAPVVLGVVAIATKASRAVRVLAGGLSVASVAIGIDAFLVEPHAFEVTRHVVASAAVDRPIRIVVLSDLQTDAVGEYEHRVVARARALRPDLVLLPGDYVQRSGSGSRVVARAVGRLLDTLAPPLGTFAVRGNVESDGWTRDVFEGSRVRAFEGTTTVSVAGLSITALSFDDSFDVALRVPDAPGFHVVFGHGPDFSLGRIDADLLVAGHTHGGQVTLPLFGPLVTFSRVPRAVAAGGMFALDRDRKLVVSRGIGMERGNAPRLRFRCRPELVVIDVVPARSTDGNEKARSRERASTR